MQNVSKPLALKIAIFAVVYALVTSVLFGIIFYKEGKDAAIQQEIQKIELEADIIKPLIISFFNQSAKDIAFLAASESAKALSTDHSESPVNKSSYKTSLESLMFELLKNHRYYNRVGFIDSNEGNHVEVSAVRRDKNIMIVDEVNLLKNVELVALEPLLQVKEKNTVFFSNIELKPLNNSETKQAVFYAALPLLDQENKTTAIIALEVNLTDYLTEIKSTILKNIAFYLATSSGEVFFPTFNADSTRFKQISRIFAEQDIKNGSPAVLKDYKNEESTAKFAYYSAISSADFPRQPRLHLIIENHNLHFVQSMQAIQLRTAAISLSVAIFSILMFVYLANKIVKPIKDITQSIVSFDKTQVLGQLPTELNDEVGTLARSFKSLVNNLTTSYLAERKAKIAATNLSSKIESILDSIADAVITIDEHGVIQAFNKAAINIFGYQEQEVLGQQIKMLIPVSHFNFSDDQNALHVKDFVKRLIGSPYEISAVRKNGEHFPILLNVSQVSTEDGVLYTGLIRDITPLKAIEEEKKRVLQDAKSAAWRLNFALSAPNIGVWELDLSTNEIKCDERVYKLFATEPKSGGMPLNLWRKLVHPDDRLRVEQEFIHFIKYKRETQYQHRIVLPSGDVRYVEAHAQIMFSDDGLKERVVGTYRDITEQMQLQDLKQHALDMAETSLKLKSNFLASMSHEIRTPMNGVIGMLGLLQQSKLSKQQQHHVFLASSSANSLLTLINDILDFSKIEAGKLDLENVEFDLRNQLSEFAESIALKAQEKRVELVLDVTKLDHVNVLGDPGRLRQILTNLVGNAIKFTETGEVVIKAIAQQKNNHVKFKCSISDTGIGIPQHKLVTLFDSFTQVDASTTRKYGGTGLGLAIVKQLCELMHGGISVESKEGKGSTFTFELTFELSNNEVQAIPKIDITGSNILIVDDNDTNLTVLNGQLKMWGANVYTANGAKQAMSLLEHKAERFFDAAIIDMQMPEKDGAMLGREIKANTATQYLPLILMTSISSHGDSEYFENLGFAAYFSKPATVSDLFDTLSLVLGGGNSQPNQSSIITHSKLLGLHNYKVVSDMPNSARIMIVEDNRINQVVLLGILQNMGLTADVAGNGKESIDLLVTCPSDAQYQLLIMDCQMPEMDGYEATKAIRAGKAGQHYIDIPIIAMTANAMKGDERKCLNAGMSDYATKPINADILQEKLCHWLGVKESSKNAVIADENKSFIRSDSNNVDTYQTNEINWDKAAFFERIRQNESLANRLISLYLTDMPQLIEQLEGAINDANKLQIRDLAHKIKGSSKNLAVLLVAQYAETIELTALDSSIDDIWLIFRQLQTAFKVVKEELNNANVY